MARTLDPESHVVRRDAFLDVAQRLIQTKGYDAFSIQDVLDEVGASKGAFYHYFGSKGDLLEAMVERMADGVEASWEEVLTRADLSALGRLEGSSPRRQPTRAPGGTSRSHCSRRGCPTATRSSASASESSSPAG